MGLLPIRRSVQPEKSPRERKRKITGRKQCVIGIETCAKGRELSSIISRGEESSEFSVNPYGCEQLKEHHILSTRIQAPASLSWGLGWRWLWIPRVISISTNTILLPTLNVLQLLPCEHLWVFYDDNYLACLPTGRPEGSINNWHQHPWQPLIQHHESWNILQSSWIKRKQTLIFPDRMEMAEPIKGKKKTQTADWDLAPHAPMCTLVHPSSWNAPFTAWELSASRHEWDAIYKRNPKTWYKPKLRRTLFY